MTGEFSALKQAVTDLAAALARQGGEQDGNWGHPSSVAEFTRIAAALQGDKRLPTPAERGGGPSCSWGGDEVAALIEQDRAAILAAARDRAQWLTRSEGLPREWLPAIPLVDLAALLEGR